MNYRHIKLLVISLVVAITSVGVNIISPTASVSAVGWANCTRKSGNLRLDTQVFWNSYHRQYEVRIWATREWQQDYGFPSPVGYWRLISLRVDGASKDMAWTGTYNWFMEPYFKQHTVFAKWQQARLFTAAKYESCSVTTQ